MVIETKEGTIFEFLEVLEVNPQQPEPQPKKSKMDKKFVANSSNSRSQHSKLMTWGDSDQTIFLDVQAYHPSLPFPSRAIIHPLEQEHLNFMKQVKGIPINTPFIKSLSQVLEYAKFLQDLINTRQKLKKNSKVILSNQSSKVILVELTKKMGILDSSLFRVNLGIT